MKVYTHRLFCDSCTGVVMYGDADDVKKTYGSRICSSCLKEQVVQSRNWILMSDDEAKIINDQFTMINSRVKVFKKK